MFKQLPCSDFFHLYEKNGINFEYPIYLFVGKNAKEDCMGHIAQGALSSYLPIQSQYADYDWSILKDKKVILFDSGCAIYLTMKKISFLLLKIGCPAVCIYSPLEKILIYTQKDLK